MWSLLRSAPLTFLCTSSSWQLSVRFSVLSRQSCQSSSSATSSETTRRVRRENHLFCHLLMRILYLLLYDLTKLYNTQVSTTTCTVTSPTRHKQKLHTLMKEYCISKCFYINVFKPLNYLFFCRHAYITNSCTM